MNISPNKMSGAYHSKTVVIDAPVELVYSIISDISSWPRWRRGIAYVRVQKKISEGTDFIWKSAGLRFRSRIHTIRPESEFGWTGKTLWISAVHNWHFKRQATKTVLTVEESLEGIASSLMKASLVRTLDKDIQDLRRAAEIKPGMAS